MVTPESEVRVMVTPEVRSGLWSHQRSGQGYGHTRGEEWVMVIQDSEVRVLVTPEVRSGLWSH
jgi:hypothetical protein